MFTAIRLIETEVHNALQQARIIGMIHVERDTKDNGYIEDGYLIAWQRDGERSNFGTHRAQVNNDGDTMLVHGHYDIPSREDALANMLERASVEKGNHILLVDKEGIDYDPPVPFGPFNTVKDAQDFAEDFREANGLPREATSDNNEEWSNAGWYFGIFQPSKKIEKWG